jgi:hypothetical protein
LAITIQGLRFLLASRDAGVSFERFCMIGRQSLMIDPSALRKLLGNAGIVLSREECKDLFQQAGGFAEPLLRLLGADEIESVDASSFEGASIIHDMNVPIADRFKNRFSAVLDGGSLEHVFNFPCAIRNCMEMAAPGGHFLALTPANNWLGHGFYQFSPELFFRVFCLQNGFEPPQVIAWEMYPNAPWYQVVDPAEGRARGKLVNGRPTCLFVLARKAGACACLDTLPQQSDYEAKWQNGRSPRSRRWKLPFPRSMREFIRNMRSMLRHPFDARYFKRLDGFSLPGTAYRKNAG